MPAIKDWLADAVRQLSKVDIASSNLDAEIILANALVQDRTYLHAHPEQIIDTPQLELANVGLNQRLNRIPIAYITGYKEFYGRDFFVNSDVLIPRPESEDIITILKEILPTTDHQLIDVGTGSGCLGITAKLEFPNLDVTLSDISDEALAVAQQNAQDLSATVKIVKSDLLNSLQTKTDIIIANLPYVDQTWQRSPETDYEPKLALFANKNGQAIIEELIIQASKLLTPNGYLIIEADPTQHASLTDFAQKNTLEFKQKLGYIVAFKQHE